MKDPQINQLIQMLGRLPGLGPRSARRLMCHLIEHRERVMMPLAAAMGRASEILSVCPECSNVATGGLCDICTDTSRDTSVMCVVEGVADLWAIERTQIFKGLYHVLGGTLSALEGRGPEELRIPELMKRLSAGTIKEVILATNATVEGQTTAHYIAERVGEMNVLVSRLASGVPIGGELDYLDDGTLDAAFRARKSLRAAS